MPYSEILAFRKELVKSIFLISITRTGITQTLYKPFILVSHCSPPKMISSILHVFNKKIYATLKNPVKVFKYNFTLWELMEFVEKYL